MHPVECSPDKIDLDLICGARQAALLRVFAALAKSNAMVGPTLRRRNIASVKTPILLAFAQFAPVAVARHPKAAATIWSECSSLALSLYTPRSRDGEASPREMERHPHARERHRVAE
jgi:hypothetical protein